MNGKLIEKNGLVEGLRDESPVLYQSREAQMKHVTDAYSLLTELQFLMEIKDPIR